MTHTVGIVQAGRWGTCLAHVIASNQREVLLFEPDVARARHLNQSRTHDALPDIEPIAEGVRATHDLAEIASHAHLILFALDPGDARARVRELGAYIDGSHLLVHTVRALEPDSLEPISHILSQETCALKTGALLGPVLVKELLAQRPNAAVIASRFPEVVEVTQAALASPTLRVYGSADLVGVETASAATSITALALGICDALDLGSATASLLTTRGLAEVARLCVAQGGEERTAFGLAGLGNLFVQREMESRNVAAGARFARGESCDEVIAALGHFDALDAARTFKRLAERRDVEAHITDAVFDILFEGLTAQDAIRRLMTLDQLSE